VGPAGFMFNIPVSFTAIRPVELHFMRKPTRSSSTEPGTDFDDSSVQPGQRLVVTNEGNDQTQECVVVSVE